MKLLTVDSSTVAASVALTENGSLLSEFFIHTGLTHSQTLLPMIEQTLRCAETELSEVDAFAVTVGPGSFTGVRIGVATVKGLAFGGQKPCVPVSTLEAMAYQCGGYEGLICPVMDARCQQVYQGWFRRTADSVERLSPDRAVAAAELLQEVLEKKEPVLLVGDGAALCQRIFFQLGQGAELSHIKIMPEPLRFQRAFGAAMAAERLFAEGKAVSDSGLVPVYLRPSQAERELKNRSISQNV